jgi:hypothetical protein
LPAAVAAKPVEYLMFKALAGPACTMFQAPFLSRGPLPPLEQLL